MNKLPMCRICLAEDGSFRLRSIINTHLQEIYELLTKTPLGTDDSGPVQACYICWTRLENSYQLRKSYLRSEEILAQILRCNDPETKPALQPNIFNKLTVAHPVVHLSVTPEGTDNEDSVDSAEEYDTVDVKQEVEDMKDSVHEEDAMQENIQAAELALNPQERLKQELDKTISDARRAKKRRTSMKENSRISALSRGLKKTDPLEISIEADDASLPTVCHTAERGSLMSQVNYYDYINSYDNYFWQDI